MLKAKESYRIYLSIVKLQLWFISLQWKTCPWAEHSDDDDDDVAVFINSLQWETCPCAEYCDDDDDVAVFINSLRWKICLWAELQPWFLSLQ